MILEFNFSNGKVDIFFRILEFRHIFWFFFPWDVLSEGYKLFISRLGSNNKGQKNLKRRLNRTSK